MKVDESKRRWQISLRVEPSSLRDQWKIRAINNKRTLNAELLFLIEEGIRAVDARKELQQ